MLARVRERIGRGVPVLTVVNKVDLVQQAPRVEGDHIYLSARSGAGIDGLRRELLRVAGWETQTAAEGVFLARERHLAALAIAADHLSTAASHAEFGNRQLELFAEELRLAAQALAAITGEFSADDLLGVIFGRFCIGK